MSDVLEAARMLRAILQPRRACGGLRRRFSSVPSPSCRVAIVYGSFASETSAEDAEIIQEYAMHRKLDLLMRVADGDEFDFDSLASCSHLVLATSSCLGHPPHNLSGFAHQLLLAGETAPGCLSHLQHAVWGNGDERWYSACMSVLTPTLTLTRTRTLPLIPTLTPARAYA